MSAVTDSPAPPASIDPLRAEQAASPRPPWPLMWGIAALAALGLLRITWEILEGERFALDRAILLALRMPGHVDRPIWPAAFTGAMRDVTALGGVTVLSLVVALTAMFLALRGLYRSAALVLAATLGGAVLVQLAKALIGRARPDAVAHLTSYADASFPSGHAANSAIVYFTIAGLLWPLMARARERAFLTIATMLLVGAIGFSRVYLGVHWPSDVAAGWLFGMLWALGWWRVELALLRRG